METVEQLVSFHHIQVQLQGGAPWGFTLKGGLEHGEPLIITKIEEDGKAAQCKKLRVGDELVNINGSALYGSRQEALILIKSSYRILRMVVRRRSVPVIRPHSWHLAKLSDPPGADSPPVMQLHPGGFSVPWQTGGESSDLSTQWNQLSRYCNADHSSSIGSMESLEPVCQGYYDSQLSPVDPVIFSNKRDSAYSSFSASSNTSDYTVSLRQEDASSMDNLFHSLGSCRYADGRCQDPDSDPGLFHEEAIRKTQSSSGRLETRARPSSYGCEEERGPLGTIRGPPQPPVRRDSFRATQGRPRAVDQRCVSAPVDISGTSSCWAEEPIKIQTRPSGPCELADDTPCQDQYYTFSSQLETCSCSQQGVSCKENVPTSRPPHGFSHSHCPGESPSAGVGGGEELPCSLSEAPKKKHGVGIHRHSAPEKLLSGQLHTLSLSSCRAPQGDLHPLGPWSSLHSEENPEIDSSKNTISQEKWAGSRCSTPGSAGALEPEVPHPNAEVPQAVSGLLPLHQTRCSPLTEPAEETAERPHPVEPRTLEDNCGGPYGVGSRNTLEQEKQEGEEKSQSLAHVAMMDSSRHRRLSKSRRRSERFATNLRNEIQRKKSQLLKCADSGNHLHGAETLEEEEWGEQHGLTSSLDTSARPVKVSSSPASLLDPFDRSASSTRGFGSLQDSVWGCQHTDRTRPSHIRVVEEPAPAGKPRRWRWTREPEPCQNVGARATEENIARKPHTRAKFENGDIPPFADRRRFFEETSRSMSVSNLPGLSGYRQRPEIQWRKLERAKVEIPGRKTEANQRRYSYQGDVDDDVKYYHPQETGRKGFFGSYSGDHEITRTSKQNDCGGSRPSNPEVGEVKVSGTCVLLPSSCFGNQIISQEKSGQKQRCRTPEVHPVKMMEKTKLSRNLSLTERDLMHCRSGLQPTEGTATPHCQYNDPGAAAQYEQRGRALSESSIHVETQHRAVPIHISVADEPAESGVAPQKKGAPPPRPPPPNWEKFYRRRASHHNLFSRPLSPARETPCPSNPAEPSRCLDVTQQSSHSLPLSDNESGAPGPVPSNPAVLQRTLRPGAPVIEALPQTVSYTWLSSSEGAPNREPDMAPNREPDMAPNREPDMAPNREPDRAPNREPDMAPNREPDRSRFSNPIHPSSQGVTEWKNTRVRSLEARAVEEDPARVEFSQEFPLPVSNDTPSRNLEPRSSLIHLEDGTLETDIDTLQESEAMGVLAEEQPQGSARPGAVLETDIDMVQEACLPSTDVLTPCSNPVVEALFGDARGTSQGQLMEELLPWSRVGDVAREIWRGGQSGLELSVDTLVRRARQASPHPQGLDAWCSSYYNTSAAKAQLLNKMKEQTELSEDEEDHELFYKKQLMESLQKKLSVLREAQRGLQVDIQANCQLGEEVEALVLAVCKPGEVDKYRMFIGDLDKVVSLLLSLSSRLLRVESALDSLSPDCGHQERLPLLEKKKQLLAQLGEAQELKEHVERREEAVCRALGRSLGPEQLQDYSHFVKMKAALLVEQRQLEDKIRLGEEQLCGLRESLALGVTVPMDQASGRY